MDLNNKKKTLQVRQNIYLDQNIESKKMTLKMIFQTLASNLNSMKNDGKGTPSQHFAIVETLSDSGYDSE